VPVLHIYLNVQLSGDEMAWHILLIASRVLVTAMLVELSVFLLLSDKFGQTQITVWQFWLVTLTFYITCHQLMVGLLQNFSVETIIKTKHIEAGHGDMQLKAFPLVVVITFIITLILIQKKLQQENRLLEAATHLSEAPLKPTADQPRKEAEYVLVHEGQTVKIELSKILYIQVTENYCHLWVQQEKTPIDIYSAWHLKRQKYSFPPIALYNATDLTSSISTTYLNLKSEIGTSIYSLKI
jgi:hypothetical protein